MKHKFIKGSLPKHKDVIKVYWTDHDGNYHEDLMKVEHLHMASKSFFTVSIFKLGYGEQNIGLPYLWENFEDQTVKVDHVVTIY
jgi:hypothetical protein